MIGGDPTGIRLGGGRLGEVPEFDQLTASLPKLLTELSEFGSWLTATYPDGYSFRRVSGRQGDEALKRLNATEESVTDAAAGMYSLSLNVRHLEASLFATAHVMRDFIDAAAYAAKEKRLGLLLCDLRSILERLAHVRYLAGELQPCVDELSDADHKSYLKGMGALEGLSRKALYGTRVIWNSIVHKELKNVNLKEDIIWPPKKELLGDYFAEQLKTKMNALEAIAPGTSACYYILCEFAHPNTGDFLAATARYATHVDRFGVVHMTRTIDKGLIAQDTNANLGVIVCRVFAFMSELIQRAKTDFGTLDRCVTQLERLLSIYMQRVIKKQKHLFSKNDLCICLSGRTIGKCCGRKLIWIR
jgi:hypothetical protein